MLKSFLNDIKQQTRKFVEENFEDVSCEKIGLDQRAGYRLWISKEAIAIETECKGPFEYYGGFDCVDNKKTAGEYTFYLASDDSVAAHIKQWQDDGEDAIEGKED